MDLLVWVIHPTNIKKDTFELPFSSAVLVLRKNAQKCGHLWRKFPVSAQQNFDNKIRRGAADGAEGKGGRGVSMTNAGCIMRKSATRETKILSWKCFQFWSWAFISINVTVSHVCVEKSTSVCASVINSQSPPTHTQACPFRCHCQRCVTVAVLSIRFSCLCRQTLIPPTHPGWQPGRRRPLRSKAQTGLQTGVRSTSRVRLRAVCQTHTERHCHRNRDESALQRYNCLLRWDWS